MTGEVAGEVAGEVEVTLEVAVGLRASSASPYITYDVLYLLAHFRSWAFQLQLQQELIHELIPLQQGLQLQQESFCKLIMLFIFLHSSPCLSRCHGTTGRSQSHSIGLSAIKAIR